MKPFWMIYTGPDCEGHVTCGRAYKVIAKIREAPLYPGGKCWYTYIFIDNSGRQEPASSNCFVSAAKRMKRAA